MTGGLKNVGSGIAHFFGDLWAKIEPTIEAAATAAGHVAIHVIVPAAAAALAAAQNVHAAGGSKSDIKDAALKAGEQSLKTVGVTVGLQELGTLAIIAEHAASSGIAEAPPAA